MEPNQPNQPIQPIQPIKQPETKENILLNNEKLIARIKEREATLKNAAIELKKHFVGIDDQIDKICDSIRTWLYMPELMTRPCIVCLVGPTGVGKTDLVRRLVKLLGFQDKYCEIELANNNSSSWARSVGSIIRQNTGIRSGEPSILLLDEIQGFRTIDEHNCDILEYDMKDVWTLLSDGKLPYKAEIESLLNMLWDFKKKDLMKETPAPKKPRRPKSSAYPQTATGPAGRVFTSLKQEKKRLAKISAKISADALFKEIMVEDGESVENKFNYYNLNYFKTLLRLSEPLEEIATWTDEKKKQVIMQRMMDKSIFEEEDFTKTLIFVSGNIDEAYGFARNAKEVDIDADILNERSKKINVLDIKGALGKRFRPEQISRFGNTYVIYPSLSKDSFEQIIVRKLETINRRVKEQTGVEIEIDKSINRLIYDNGVFPTQGTRPLFSTISEILETSLPGFLLEALINFEKKMLLKYKNGNLIATLSKKNMQTKYTGSLDRLKNLHNSNFDRKALSSVHEAAHAVIYALLFKMSPSQIVSTPISEDLEGFVYSQETSPTREMLLNRICVTLAGQEAEKIVFGKDNQTAGNADDVRKATNLANNMVRCWGMCGFASAIGDAEKATEWNNDVEPTNPIIENIMKEACEKARVLILDNKRLYVEIVESLMSQDKISPEDFKTICKKYGLEIGISDNTEDILYSDFKKKLDEFKNERK